MYKLLSLMLLGFKNANKKNWRHNTSMPTPEHLNLGGPQMQILNCTHDERHWLVFDSPVDTLWIEGIRDTLMHALIITLLSKNSERQLSPRATW